MNLAELHPAAEREIEQIFEWYRSQDRAVAAEFLEALRRARAEISTAPGLWPIWPEGGESTAIRVHRMKRFPDLLPYIVREEHVIVHAIAHERREAGYWRNRSGN